VEAEAHEIVLLEELPDGHWRTRQRFPLGG
jgi:hypothetical protein